MSYTCDLLLPPASQQDQEKNIFFKSSTFVEQSTSMTKTGSSVAGPATALKYYYKINKGFKKYYKIWIPVLG